MRDTKTNGKIPLRNIAWKFILLQGTHMADLTAWEKTQQKLMSEI